jgi:hypothetical protein
METYWGVYADSITFRDFWTFARRHWRDLLRYLRWADRMERSAG